MHRIALIFAAALLWPTQALAQQGSDAPKRLERKAQRLVQNDPSYKDLNPVEERIVICTIAKKLREINRYNWAHPLSARKTLTKADVGLVVSDSDLDGLLAKHPELTKKRVAAGSEEKLPPGEPVTVELPGEMVLREVHGEPFHGLFKDNEWDIQEGSPDALDLIDQIDDALEVAGKGGRIEGLEIRSSASTLPNSGTAASMTFLDLSKARAQAALKFILKKLLEKGVVLDQSQVQILPEGSNGDGTSGPPAPGADYWKQDQKAAPSRDDYDQYKYVDVTIQVKVPEEGPKRTTTVIPEGGWSSRAVTLDMAVKEKRWQIWTKIKKVFVYHKHTTRRHALPTRTKKHKSLPCTYFQQKGRR